MADNEPTISMAGINAPPLYRLVEDGDKTVIMTADTNTPMWVINGKIGGDTVEVMTTAERTAITPEAGQLIYDTTLGILFVGDGSTQGGTAVGGGGGGGVVPGYRLSDDGTSLNFNPVQPIVNVTGSSVTLVPDTAYKMYATTGAVTINANPPASGYWGLESHIELFVSGTGYVVTGTNVVLAQALEPDSVNNCTVRFHDGLAIISVEDHVAGYIVVSATGSTAGTLPYALSTASQEYVAFDASLNGTTIPLAGATANGEKHVVGNGYENTVLTGGVSCTSKTTFANLAMSGAAVTGGTMTLGDVYIPQGATVSVNGGGLAVEKVSGNGGVIDLGGTSIIAAYIVASGCTLTGGSGYSTGGNRYGGFLYGGGKIDSCTITGNYATHGGGVYCGYPNVVLDLTSCSITGNTASQAGNGLYVNSATANLSSTYIDGNDGGRGQVYAYSNAKLNLLGGCTVGVTYLNNASMTFAGSNRLAQDVTSRSTTEYGTVTLASGAILDLTGNTNATPINPGGGITFAEGGATVLYSSGAVSGSYTMDNVALPGMVTSQVIENGVTSTVIIASGAKLTNTAVVDLGGGRIAVPSNSTVSVSGVTFTGGYASATGNGGGVLSGTKPDVTFVDCVLSGNSSLSDGGALKIYGGVATLSNCVITGNTTGSVCGGCLLQNGASCTMQGTTISGNVATTATPDLGIYDSVKVDVNGDCTLGSVVFQSTDTSRGTLTLAGSNNIKSIQPRYYGGYYGNVVISSGAIVNLETSIAPGGTITVLTGGCTVNGHPIVASTYTSIASDGTTVPPQPE